MNTTMIARCTTAVALVAVTSTVSVPAEPGSDPWE